jgi:hypothetical protein
MSAIIVGTTGATWGLSAETGIICQSAGAKETREKNQVRNETGDFVMISFFNPTKTHTIEGVVKSSTGVAAAAPGVALTVANTFGSYGAVSAGGIYTDDIDVKGVNNDFTKISVNATQYPLIS